MAPPFSSSSPNSSSLFMKELFKSSSSLSPLSYSYSSSSSYSGEGDSGLSLGCFWLGLLFWLGFLWHFK